MDTLTLDRDIGVIFFDETTRNSFDRKYKTSSRNRTGEWEGIVVSNTKDYKLEFPNLEILLKLYSKIEHDKDLRKYFIEKLLNRISNNTSSSYLAFETLVKLGFLKEAISTLNETILNCMASNEKINDDVIYAFRVLSDIIKFEYTIFDESQLSFIKEQFSSSEYMIKIGSGVSIFDRINKIFYLKLKRELDEVNLQINQDEETVKKKLSYFGFPPILGEMLNKIDKMYYNSSNDKFDFSMVIGKLREFLADLVNHISIDIKKKTGTDWPKEGETLIARQRIYLRNHLALSEGEHIMINGLVKILNEEGSHAFVSEKEYFRLTRNVLIEVSLLILTKLEKFKKA